MRLASVILAGCGLVSGNSDLISNSFIYDDQTIRPFGDTNDVSGWCFYKRWADYVSGQELWMWPCAEAAHANWRKAAKYKRLGKTRISAR